MNCQHCNKHKGTEKWVGDGGMMAAIHGAYEIWCKCCCIKAQIESAELAVKRLPKLIKEFEGICGTSIEGGEKEE